MYELFFTKKADFEVVVAKSMVWSCFQSTRVSTRTDVYCAHSPSALPTHLILLPSFHSPYFSVPQLDT